MYYHLFKLAGFTAHSGDFLNWKCDCDVLTSSDWDTLAYIAVMEMGLKFATVEGVPRGGAPFAFALATYATGKPDDPLLIADDVLTTGASMEAHRAGRDAIGIVAFARGPLPDWIRAIWTLET